MAVPGDEYEEILGARYARDAASALAPRRVVLASRYGPVPVDLWPAGVNFAAGDAQLPGLGRDGSWAPARDSDILFSVLDPAGVTERARKIDALPVGLTGGRPIVGVDVRAWHASLPRADDGPTRCDRCRGLVALGAVLDAGTPLVGVPALARRVLFCLACCSVVWPLCAAGAAAGTARAHFGAGPASCTVVQGSGRGWRVLVSPSRGSQKKAALVIGDTTTISRVPPDFAASLADADLYWYPHESY